MNITDARILVKALVRDGSGETDVAVDLAIMEAGEHFCRGTKAVTRTDSVTITASSTAFPLTTPIANGFLPESFIDCWITGEECPLRVVDYAEINQLAAADDSEGTPTRLAFADNTSTSATLWPTPDAAYTAKMRWWQPFGVTVSSTFTNGWTAGTAVSGTLAGTLNIPDRLIRPVLSLGAASILKGPSPEQAYASVSWRKFLDYVAQTKGAMSLSPRVIYRAKAAGFVSTPRYPVDLPGVDG